MKDPALVIVLIFWLTGTACIALRPARADEEAPDSALRGHVSATVVSAASMDDAGAVMGEEPADIVEITEENKDGEEVLARIASY